jgi:hypothetical protein
MNRGGSANGGGANRGCTNGGGGANGGGCVKGGTTARVAKWGGAMLGAVLGNAWTDTD